MNALYNHLSKKDLIDLFEIVDSCIKCKNENEFLKIIYKLKQLILFEAVTATYMDGELVPKESVYQLSFDFPGEFLDRYHKKKYIKIDVPMNAYFNTSEIQIYSDAIKKYNNNILNAVELDSKEYGFYDGWIYGVDNIYKSYSFVFCVICSSIEKNERTKHIIKYLTNFLAVSYKNVLKKKEKQKYHLTKREIEVINWLKEGKTYWEISQILNITESGVRFHVENLKKKFEVVSLTQAVAVAMSKGIISLG